MAKACLDRSLRGIGLLDRIRRRGISHARDPVYSLAPTSERRRLAGAARLPADPPRASARSPADPPAGAAAATRAAADGRAGPSPQGRAGTGSPPTSRRSGGTCGPGRATRQGGRSGRSPRPGKPLTRKPIRFATAEWRPRSANAPSVLNVNGFGCSPLVTAAMFLPSSLPWRIACWAVGGHALPRARRVGHGGDVTDRPDVVVALHAHVLVADDAAVLERQPQPRGDRARAHARGPDDGPGT